MNYSALIENRKSVRSFTDKKVSVALLRELEGYYNRSVMRLVPEIKTALLFFDDSSKEALEGAAGYNQFLVGAPQYLVLLSEKHEQAYLNGGFIMEDLILKAAELGLDSCWLTFTDSEEIKNAIGISSDLDVAAVVALGYGTRQTKRLRLNIRSMSDIDIQVKRHYTEPKRSIYDMVYLDTWGNTYKLDDYIGFFDDMLWEAFHAATLAPSYLNRQAYGFLIHDGHISLISRPDLYTTRIDGELSLGIVLHHFTAAASDWAGNVRWTIGTGNAPALPEGHRVVASCTL